MSKYFNGKFLVLGPFPPKPDGLRLDRLLLHFPLHLVHHVDSAKHPESPGFRPVKSSFQANQYVGPGSQQVQVVERCIKNDSAHWQYIQSLTMDYYTIMKGAISFLQAIFLAVWEAT